MRSILSSKSSKSYKPKKKSRNRRNRPSYSEKETNESFFSSHTEVLMNAARSGDEETVMKLYFERIDLTITDEDGNTALHIAAMNGQALICRLLIVLTTPAPLWRITNKAGLRAEQLATTEKVRADLHSLEHGSGSTHNAQRVCNDRLVERMDEWPENAKLLFSFDGGGVKALIIMQMLIQLDHLIPGGLLPRIDWIAGTSSGGLLGLMLGTERSLSSARRFHFENCSNVFCGNTTQFPKHDASGVEEALKRCFGETTRMSAIKHKKVMVTVADTRKTPATLILFRTYAPRIPNHLKEEYGYLDPDRIPIWKAGRCTSAAPYYFASYNGLSDGAIVANNPTLALLTDFYQFHELEEQYTRASEENVTREMSKSSQRPSVGVVVSFGTGQVEPKNTDGIDFNLETMTNANPLQIAKTVMGVFNGAKNALHLLLREVTESHGQPVRYARAWCHSMNAPYYRLCPRLDKTIPLDVTDIEEIVNFVWETELYIRGEAHEELEQLASLIARKPLPHKAGALPTTLSSNGLNEVSSVSSNPSTRGSSRK